jgi:hypothetical protein
MADTKVTTMQQASGISSGDLLYLVKPTTSPYDHKLSIANLFGGITVPAVFEKAVCITGQTQTVTGGSDLTIDVSKNVTVINNPDGSGVLNISAGTDGQLKVIVVKNNNAGHALALTGDVGVPVQFTSSGAALLICVANLWWYIGGTATVVD